MPEFYSINSIHQAHQFLGMPPPLHPLVTVFRAWPEIDFDFSKVKMTSDLYLISLKGKVSGQFSYGRTTYDYQEGTLTFIAPHQVLAFDVKEQPVVDTEGWNILFHPDLIRKSSLANTIKEYSFFDYDLNEALHLSDKEMKMLTALVSQIETELNQNIDKHSHELILVNLESILKYCHRYYDRQFYTRTDQNKGYLSRFNHYLENYFESDELIEKGMPSLQDCGLALEMSGSYLSDLLRVETGRSAKDHIHAKLIDKAKNFLLASNHSISEIAYKLGFDYPQHFSQLFKKKTGETPSAYRKTD